MTDFTQQELYKMVLASFKRQMANPNPQIQMLSLIGDVDREAKFLMTGKQEWGGNYQLSNSQHEEIADIIWDLIIQRVITFTTQGYPWLRATNYGKKVIESEGPIPHDVTGYLEALKRKIPNVNKLVIMYLDEALLCFRGGAYRAAAVMLGVVSEEVFLDLIRSFEKKYSQKFIPPKYKPFRQIEDAFKKQFELRKDELESDLKNNIEQTLTGIHDLIKKGRDDSGHPTGIEVAREEIVATFSLLPIYIERVYKIIGSYER